jgi:enamine deaminase RidA (YjgF/YER057c/UK114 family)
MDDAAILARLSELGIDLPEPPTPVAAYVPCVIHGGLAFVAGQVPMADGELLHPGRLGEGVNVTEGADAARQAALQAVAALRHGLEGSFVRLERILQVTVLVAAIDGFVDHSKVANGASELLVDVFGEEGRHARAAVGVSSLPLGSSVEVVVTAAVRGT